MGRITGYISPEDTVNYTYDVNGNVLTVTDSHGTIARTYDALNRVISYTDTYGKTICYEYDAVGNLSKLVYPDNTAVTYAYDANHNLIRVTDWANRVTSYTYDENNRVVGVIKPDGSVTTTVYDNKQRVTSTVERTAGGVVITGFEYTYDDLSRIIEEKVLANSTKMCYTYDSLNRVTSRTVKRLADNSVISTETYTYDATGNITDAPDSCFEYDTNNQFLVFNGNPVSYDLDGNMLSNGNLSFTYDSANRLTSAGLHTYTYNVENVRVRNSFDLGDTTYVYDTRTKLSKLLMKTSEGFITKYVYGKGLIGEESDGTFKTYHFDCRGSTIAITNTSGTVTDTFTYDTYGKLLSRTGTTETPFMYDGRDGVLTDDNGLLYMRARYYSPEMRRFVNADIVADQISNAITLNRYAYANGNPVPNIDPLGLSAERGGGCEACYSLAGALSPWGTPNTHVTYFDKYWLERWYGPDGKAVKDRHWTDHSSPTTHSNPHNQTWDWSDPEHPKLLPSDKSSDDDHPEPPTSVGVEEWIPSEVPDSAENDATNSKSNSNQYISVGNTILGIAIVTVSAAALIWLVGNDASGVGTADDALIVPVSSFFTYGYQLILGT